MQFVQLTKKSIIIINVHENQSTLLQRNFYMKKLLTSVAAASMILVRAFGTASIATAAPVAHNNPVAVTGTGVCNTPGGQEYAKDPVKVYY